MAARKPNILVVEDSAVDARLLQAAIAQSFGETLAVTIVETMAAARKEFLQAEIDVVILDLNLPDSAGTASVQAIRSLDTLVPILVVTGDDDPALDFKTVAAGGSELIRKGPDMGERLPLALVRLYHSRAKWHNDIDGISRRLDSALATLESLLAISEQVRKNKIALFGTDELPGVVARIDVLEHDFTQFRGLATRGFWSALTAAFTAIVGAGIALLFGVGN